VVLALNREVLGLRLTLVEALERVPQTKQSPSFGGMYAWGILFRLDRMSALYSRLADLMLMAGAETEADLDRIKRMVDEYFARGSRA